MKIVPTNEVKKGSIIGTNIKDAWGAVLVKKDTVITQQVSKRLIDLGYEYLYIKDPEENVHLKEVIPEELRIRLHCDIKEGYKKLKKYLNDKKNRKVSTKQLVDERYEYTKELLQNIPELVDYLLDQEQIYIQNYHLKNSKTYYIEHSVNVAIISIAIGIECKLSRKDLIELAIGAFIHDIGYNDMVNEKEKKSVFKKSEMDNIYSHPTIGFHLIENNIDIPLQSKLIVLQHHKGVESGGYPNEVDRKDITLFSKIVAIADKYDALTSNRPWRSALSPNEAIRDLHALALNVLDVDLVKIFNRILLPYPVGTMVLLSTGEVGFVVKNNEGFPLRPIVNIKSNKVKSNSLTRDLLKDYEVNIVSNYFRQPEVYFRI